MRKKLKKLRKLDKFEKHSYQNRDSINNRKLLHGSKVSYANNMTSSKKYNNTTSKTNRNLIIGFCLITFIFIICAVVAGSKDEQVSMFSGKEYLKSLNIANTSDFNDEFMDSYLLNMVDGYAIGVTNGDGTEKRYRFSVRRDGLNSYDVELTDVQVQLRYPTISNQIPRVDVFKRTYKNKKGEYVSTFYYKVVCPQGMIKNMDM